MPQLYVGLMSGTSLDGVDAALVDFDAPTGRLVASRFLPYPDDVRAEALALCAPGANEIERAGDLSNRIADLYADAVNALLGGAAHGVRIEAIGATGRPYAIAPSAASPSSCSTPHGSPSAPGSRRRRPAQPRHRRRRPGRAARAGLPRGVLRPAGPSSRDREHRRHRERHGPRPRTPGARLRFRSGQCAARSLGARVTSDSATTPAGPGARQDASWRPCWARCWPSPTSRFRRPRAQAGSSSTPAGSIGSRRSGMRPPTSRPRSRRSPPVPSSQAVSTHCAGAQDVLVCGGGVHNAAIMAELARALPAAGVASTAAAGVDPDWVEAMAFAWLARAALAGVPGNIPSVTGAAGPRRAGRDLRRLGMQKGPAGPFMRRPYRAAIRPRTSSRNRRCWSRSGS